MQEPALFDFSSADGVGHEVWRVPRLKINRSSTRSRGSTRSTLPTVIIAPRRRRGRAGRSPRRVREHDRVLAVAFPDNQMQVLPYNRVVSDLRRLDAWYFLGD